MDSVMNKIFSRFYACANFYNLSKQRTLFHLLRGVKISLAKKEKETNSGYWKQQFYVSKWDQVDFFLTKLQFKLYNNFLFKLIAVQNWLHENNLYLPECNNSKVIKFSLESQNILQNATYIFTLFVFYV